MGDQNHHKYSRMANPRESTPEINDSQQCDSYEAAAYTSNGLVGDLLTPSVENGSKDMSSSLGIQPHHHIAVEDSSVGQAQQHQGLSFDTNDSNIQQRPSCTELTRKRRCQIDQNLSFGKEYSIFREAEFAELPGSDPVFEDMDSETKDVVPSSSPLTIADYNVCSVEIINGILVIEDITPETRHTLPSSSPLRSSLRSSQKKTSTATDHLSQGFNCNRRAANVGLSETPSFTSNAMQCDAHPMAFNTLANSAGSDNVMQQIPSSLVPGSAPGSNSEVELNAEPLCTSNVMQIGLPSPILNDTLAGSLRYAGTSSFQTKVEAISFIEPTEAKGVSDSEQNKADQLLTGNWLLPPRKLLLEKLLSKTDVEAKIEGVLLPKRSAAANFPLSSYDDVLNIEMHDGEEEGKTWSMQMTISACNRRDYRLKNTREYAVHHNLKEGDCLQIYLEVHSNGHRHILVIKRRVPDCIQFSLDDARHMDANPWKLIITKRLSKTDVKLGQQSVGSILLPRKEVTSHFPEVPDKEGVQIRFHDFNARFIWFMKLTFESTQKRGRTYFLQNSSRFSKHYALQEGNWLYIYKNATDASYALSTSKEQLMLSEPRFR